MTQPPTLLTGQDIGQAAHATRAVLEHLLADHDLAFNPWVTLNVLGSNGSELDQSDILTRVVHGLKVAEPTARAAVTRLLEAGLITATPPTADDPRLALTPAGTATFEQVHAGIRQITERLYGGLPSEDLAVAYRVLSTVTGRANAELSK